ncbi:sterol desaturase family protein [Dankookia rubra]|nr:sterol desaturase family protein [Dankookia rubra]
MLSLKLIHPFAILPFVVGNIALAIAVHAGLTQLLGERPAGEMSGLAWATMLLLLIIVEDFMTFFGHYLLHAYASLWELHKTHHSAEFLVPLTNRRLHPLQTIFEQVCTATAVGVAAGVLAYAFALPLAEFFVAKVDAYYIVNALSFHHLRHSHVRLSYGWLERYLLSPAQHQLHHSCLREHWDKNFGLLFSCWDRLFGTIAYSRPGDVYQPGLPPGSGEFSTVAQLYLTPLQRIAQSAVHRLGRRQASGGGTGSELAPAAAPPPPHAAP